MGLPDAKTLFGVTVSTGADESDDLADCLREMHGHMATGNHKGAAEAFRAAYRIMASEPRDRAGADGQSLYDEP